MRRLRDRAWQQGIAILLVLAGSILIYLGARDMQSSGATAWAGMVLFATGIAVPLAAQLFRASPEDDTGRCEDV